MQESLHQAVHKKDPNRVPREGERERGTQTKDPRKGDERGCGRKRSKRMCCRSKSRETTHTHLTAQAGRVEDHVLCMRCYGYDGGVVLTRRRKRLGDPWHDYSPVHSRDSLLQLITGEARPTRGASLILWEEAFYFYFLGHPQVTCLGVIN
ncbi:hypothetical protein CSHISOI_11849 [Colletotrichum shisoi]|uniref:Uncharacterized protein n=1 Tax=Colletotrichum shisoi TaxID=2078593 RepID=A0A5Q4BAF6_9PEZI|nr:hypothetical protein CSHISOI_11849 [Colletotrichum shisoi]